MKNSLLITLCFVVGFIHGSAQEFKDSVTIYFHQSKTNIDSKFKDNEEQLDRLIERLDSTSQSKKHLKSISVVGAASPEGSVKFNNYLSEKRAGAIFDFINKFGSTDSQANLEYLGRDWGGLLAAVSRDEKVPYKNDVLKLLDEITSNPDFEHPLQKLKRLHNGEPYIYMYNIIFPSLRMSKVILSYDGMLSIDKDSLFKPSAIPVNFAYNCPDLEFNYLYGEVKQCKPLYLGLKTNLLYDALLIPNIGAELYVGKGWSVTADWMYGWWDKDRTHYYWRAYGGTLGVRKWFGSKAAAKPLTGHHLGVDAGVITYDFELGGKGYMGGKPHGTLWDRCNYMATLEYGYSLPVSRRLNIDFTIGFGYIGGKVLEYVPADGFYIWQSTRQLHWVGPTKAEISLVWLIGCDNFNRMKGGRL